MDLGKTTPRDLRPTHPAADRLGRGFNGSVLLPETEVAVTAPVAMPER